MCELLESTTGIIGVVVGWVLNYLGNRGKVTLHSSYCKMFTTEPDGGGSFFEKPLSKDSAGGNMKFELLIYNNSNNNRIIKELKVLLKSNIIKSSLVIIDEDSEKIRTPRSDYGEDSAFLNIPPNSVMKKHYRISLGKDEVTEIFEKNVKIKLIGKKLYGIIIFRKFSEDIFSFSKGIVKYV